MPMYDFVCPSGHEQIDVQVPYGTRPACPTCGEVTDILWRSSFPNVIGDDIPGGMTIEHMTATPETFYTKSDHRRRMKELGLRIRDHHNPPPGSDKSRFTTRQVAIDAVTLENARILTERQQGVTPCS